MKMNKIAAAVLAVGLALPAFAQEQGSSSGKETPAQRAERDYSSWLPSAGEFSIGFGLDPLSTWVGQLFNGHNTGNALGKLHGDPMTGTPTIGIMGSYQLSSQLGVKVNMGFNNTRLALQEYQLDDALLFANPLSEARIADHMVHQSKLMSFALGADYRIGGKHAVQAVLGAGLIYARKSDAYKLNYGNAITEANQAPSSTDFSPIVTNLSGHHSFMPNARLKEKAEATNTFGLYGSVGVEWFFVPKVCLGANVNIQLTNERQSRSFETWEGWNVDTQKLEEAHTDLGTSTGNLTTFATSHLGSNLYISFYF